MIPLHERALALQYFAGHRGACRGQGPIALNDLEGGGLHVLQARQRQGLKVDVERRVGGQRFAGDGVHIGDIGNRGMSVQSRVGCQGAVAAIVRVSLRASPARMTAISTASPGR